MADDAAAPEDELIEASDQKDDTASDDATAEKSTDEATESPEPDTDSDAAEEDTAEDFDAAAASEPRQPVSRVKLATIFGLVVVLALGGLVGWVGWRAYQSHETAEQRALFLQVGKQAALNLTTIDFEHADADVKRILDSATDAFYDDFSRRSQPFIDVVKQAKSKSTGEIAAAGLESDDKDGAQVLVAVTVKTSNAGAPEQAPRAWRMRISVRKIGDEAKVSNVEFVP
ncbi:MAG: tetratricopeptide repeat protein [Mycobacterium sp.]